VKFYGIIMDQNLPRLAQIRFLNRNNVTESNS
jgi:hypothetical protein